MAKSPLSRLQRAATAGITVAGAAVIALTAALPAGATASSTTAPANNIIVGSGSSTTYTMMQGLDTLFNGANTCPLTSDNTGTSGSAQPLDFSCVTGAGADQLALTAPQNENPWGDVSVQEPAIGSGSGIKQLEIGYGATPHNSTWTDGTTTTYLNVANNINYARSSRDPSNSASTGTDWTGLNFVAYATDGVSWVHYLTLPGGATHTTHCTNGTCASPVDTGSTTVPSASAAVSSLSTAQISAIWKGTAQVWGDVGLCADGTAAADCTTHMGASNLPIVVFSAQEGSGTQSTWKGTVGSDPTQTSSGGATSVNCVGTGANATTFVDAGGSCNGAITIFENELTAMTAGSFSSTQLSHIAPVLAAHGAGGTATDTLVNGYTATTTKNASKSTKLVVAGSTIAGGGGNTAGTSTLSKLSTGISVSVSGNAGATTVTNVVVTPAKFSHGVQTAAPFATLTLSSKVTAAAGSTVSWSATSSPTRHVTTATNDDAARSLGIFFYSFGKWKNQAGQAQNASWNGTSPVNCATGCGGQVLSGGYTAALGQVGGIAPTSSTVLNKSFPVRRYLYNVYSNGTNANVAPVATPATLNYVSEAGFICKPQNSSIVDPATGLSYINSIQSVIISNGFVPLSAGAATGVVNQTPISDEVGSNTVGTLAAQLNLKTGSHDYSTVMNTPASSSYTSNPNSNAGISSYTDGQGGYANPSGFCLVNSTDSSHAGA